MKAIPFLVISGLFAACSSVPTDVHYGPVGAVAGVDGGYSSLRRTIDTWAVRYTGDQYMAGSTVRDLALLRSAEIAQNASFQWFVVTEKINESGHNLKGTTFSDVSTVQYETATRTKINAASGEVRTSDTKFIPQYRYEIKCFREDPGDPEALDATVVQSELRQKYGIPE
jgi:hypothetical protein